LVDRLLLRTPLVAQDEDFINLQDEVAIPGSPTAALWIVGGTDVGLFYSLGTGCIALKASTRATITPGSTLALTVRGININGSSDTVDLSVVVPLDADCRFVSFVSGNDANNGTTPALAWQHIPRNYDFTGTQVTLGAGKVVFFKGEIHRTWLDDGTSAPSNLPHAGTSGNPFTYMFTGWGGRASLDGSDVVASWSPASLAQVANNPYVANISTATLSASGTLYQHLYDGNSMCFPAQWPTPVDLFDFENVEVDGDGGMWRVSATTGSPRMTQSGTTITIVDPRIAARYGNVALADMPPSVQVWAPGNNVNQFAMASYDYATSTITCTSSSSTPPASTSGMTAYSLVGHPYDIVKAGQFAFVLGSTTQIVAWLPEDAVKSYSVRPRGITLGVSYVRYQGLQSQRYCGGPTGGTPSGGGTSFHMGYSTGISEVECTDVVVRQMRAQTGDGCGFFVSGTGGVTDAIVQRFHYQENVKGSGFRAGLFTTSLTTPTPAQVRAHPWGKIRYNYGDANSIGRTFILVTQGTGLEISLNILRYVQTVHGNGLSLYNDTIAGYTNYCVVERNTFDDCSRPYTTSITASLADTNRHNLFNANVFLASDALAFNMFSGEPGGEFTRNIGMAGASSTYTGDGILIDNGYNITLSANVFSGIASATPYVAGAGGTAIYSITDNLMMVNDLPVNTPPDQVQTGNTVAAVAPTRIWDKVISAEMAAALGAGAVGAFWSVP